MPPRARAELTDSGVVITDLHSTTKEEPSPPPLEPVTFPQLALHLLAVPLVNRASIHVLQTYSTGSAKIPLLQSLVASQDAKRLTIGVATATAGYAFVHRCLVGVLGRYEFYERMGVEERNRIQGYSLSFVNAILMTSLGLRSHLAPSPADLDSISFFAAYLLTDLSILLKYPYARAIDITHHFLSLALCHAMLYKNLLESHRGFVMLTEFSTIFLDLARVLPVAGLGKTKGFLASAVLFAVSFVGVRIVWFGKLLWDAHSGRDKDWDQLPEVAKWVARGLFGMQVWWTGEILKKAGEVFGWKK